MLKRANFKILAVDDDGDILDLLKYNFRKHGYAIETTTDPNEAIPTALRFKPDLIILDVMMPGTNGIDLCKAIREVPEFERTYIFFLTARTENYLRTAGYENGGDDFIEKFSGLRALVNKVNAVLQGKLVIRKNAKIFRIGRLAINRESNLVTYGDKQVKLSNTELDLLLFLAQNPETLSKEVLLSNIWGSEIYLQKKNVESYVQKIRQGLGLNIITNNERGFKLNPY